MTQTNDQTIYLTANQVIMINAIQIEIYSPKEQIGVKEPGMLDSALNRPKQTIFGNDAYPSIHEKSAALTESLGSNNAFYNANKRTALASLIVFLNLNEYKWIMDVHKEQTFIVDIVNHKYTFSELAFLIKDYSSKN